MESIRVTPPYVAFFEILDFFMFFFKNTSFDVKPRHGKTNLTLPDHVGQFSRVSEAFLSLYTPGKRIFS